MGSAGQKLTYDRHFKDTCFPDCVRFGSGTEPDVPGGIKTHTNTGRTYKLHMCSARNRTHNLRGVEPQCWPPNLKGEQEWKFLLHDNRIQSLWASEISSNEHRPEHSDARTGITAGYIALSALVCHPVFCILSLVGVEGEEGWRRQWVWRYSL